MSRSRLSVVAVFLFALALRFLGLTWGLPNAERWASYHPDESLVQIPGAVYEMIRRGDFNPGFFAYPSLTVYTTYFAFLVASGLGLSSPPAAPFPWNSVRDIILCARVVTALLGALTVLPVYGLGRAFVSHRAGLFAAFLLALVPGHLQHSHFATVDVPATFFVALSLWLSARALESETPKRWIVWASVAAGLAAGSKYNAGLVLVAPLLALWFRRRELSLAFAPLCVLLSALVFLLTTPFAVLDFQTFWGNPQREGGLAFELLVHPRIGSGDIFVGTGNGWIYHLLVNAPFLFTLPLFLVAIVGACLTKRAPQPAVGALMLAFVLLYALPLGLSQVRFMRYLLPLAPVVCVWAAWCVWFLGAFVARTKRTPENVRLQRVILAVALSFVVYFGALNAFLPFVSSDPRDGAAIYVRDSSSAPATVGLVNAPWFYTPPLTPQNINRRVEASPDARFRFVYTGLDAAQLSRDKPQLFVISEYEWTEKQRLNDASWRDFQTALNRDYTLVRRFMSRRVGPRRDYEPHDYLYTHPEVRVYERKS